MEETIPSTGTHDERVHSVGGDPLGGSDEVYAKLIERGADAIAVLDGATVVDCNAAALELFDGNADDFIGKTPWEISPIAEFERGFTAPHGREYIREAYKKGSVRFDWKHRRPDGTELTLDVSLTRIDLAEKQRLVVAIRDITGLRFAEQELREHIEFQRRLAACSRRLATASPDLVDERITEALQEIGEHYGLDHVCLWWDDPQAGTGYCSHEWARDGHTSTGRTISLDQVSWSHKLLHSGQDYFFTSIDELPEEAVDDRAFCKAEGVQSLFVTPIAIDMQIVGTASFSTQQATKDWTRRIRDELGVLAQLLGSTWRRDEYLRQVVEREAELSRSQQVAHLGSFVETAGSGQFLSDDYGTLRMSDEACAIFGIEPGTETVALALSRMHPDDRERVLQETDESFATKQGRPIEYRVIRPDGVLVHVEQHADAEYDEQGRVTRWFGTVQDVTDRVESRHKLENALAVIEALANRLQDENILLKQEVRSARRDDRMVGDNPRFRNTLAAVEKVAPTDVAVLILGETGTGKELVAREIHAQSERRETPMISVNCAALSSDLIESELFGHEAGAFTGADKQRKGRFELADGGTLFLDEIGDLSLDVQAKILRVLQSGEFERLGGIDTLTADVRLITATHRDLWEMVQSGTFRADLYYRINSFPIEIPALRERKDDIPLLARHFVDKYAARLGKEISTIAPDMIERMCRMNWPGNVRQLESHMQRAIIAASGPVLDYSDPEQVANLSAPTPDLDTLQQQHIISVLDRCNWVIGGDKGAAAMLGVPPSTLRSRMKKLGIERPD